MMTYLFMYLFIYVFIYLCIYLFIYLFICLFIYVLFIYFFICFFISLFLYLFIIFYFATVDSLPTDSAVVYSEVILMTARDCGSFYGGVQVAVVMAKLLIPDNLKSAKITAVLV